MEPSFIENLIKVGMAVLVGGLIGAEREFQDKAAGFRTIILITLGSTLFTIFSLSMDPGFTQTRIAANIVTGIGFLGAGAIVREGGRIAGLTTAATIWLAAALGMGIGAGSLYFVLAATGVTILVLIAFPKLEARIDRIRESRSYEITLAADDFKKVEKISELFDELSLRVFEHHQAKNEKSIISTWKVIGSPHNHEKFIQAMMRDKAVKELTY
ncbi:MAG: MgtC/SapB family protein [Chloroflexi bacterium]|nr:MgtC/SapB family protein [Chloroflexota bacterium]MDL1940954.1 MgtC/SapB family protein [Chloroflexi bacterium CFX2]